MKGLDTLIKLHKRTLDELRRQIGALENEKQQLITLSNKLADDLKDEMKMATKQSEMSQFFGGFAKRIQQRQQGIAGEIKTLDQKIDTLTDAAKLAFGEVKKFEIAKANALRRKQKETVRKETIALDEIAGTRHQRKKK